MDHPDDLDSHNTYADLYQALSDDLSHEVAWQVVTFLFVFYFVPLMFLVLYLTPESSFWSWMWFSFLSYLIVVFALAIIFSAWLNNLNLSNYVACTSANLLARLSPPRKQARGFNFQELENLRRVAEIEQSSADWRGGIVSAVLIAIVLTQLAPALIQADSVLFDGIAAVVYDQPNPVVATVSMAVTLIAFFLILGAFLRHFRLFINKEFSNRVILLACLESKNILQECGLANQSRLTIIQRKVTVNRLDYTFTSSKPRAVYYSTGYDPGETWREQTGDIWYLYPPESSLFFIVARDFFTTMLRIIFIVQPVFLFNPSLRFFPRKWRRAFKRWGGVGF